MPNTDVLLSLSCGHWLHQIRNESLAFCSPPGTSLIGRTLRVSQPLVSLPLLWEGSLPSLAPICITPSIGGIPSMHSFHSISHPECHLHDMRATFALPSSPKWKQRVARSLSNISIDSCNSHHMQSISQMLMQSAHGCGTLFRKPIIWGRHCWCSTFSLSKTLSSVCGLVLPTQQNSFFTWHQFAQNLPLIDLIGWTIWVC